MNKHPFRELDVHEKERICWQLTANFHKFSLFREQVQTARWEANWRASTIGGFFPEYKSWNYRDPGHRFVSYEDNDDNAERPPKIWRCEDTRTISWNIDSQTVDVAGCGHKAGDSDVEAYFEDKLRSLGEGELRALAEVTVESIAQILGGPCSSGRVDATPLYGGGFREQVEENIVCLTSTPVIFPKAVSINAPASMVVFGETPCELVITFNEEEEVVGGACRSEMRWKCSGE